MGKTATPRVLHFIYAKEGAVYYEDEEKIGDGEVGKLVTWKHFEHPLTGRNAAAHICQSNKDKRFTTSLGFQQTRGFLTPRPLNWLNM